MSKRTQRLGRGLESLIGSAAFDLPDPSAQEASAAPVSTIGSKPARFAIQSVPIDQIEANPYQPRQRFGDEGLAELAQSISTDGILQPIAVRQVGGKYQIIAGERRWRAARLVGLASVPVVVRQADEHEMLVLALVENVHREDLNAIEKAQAYEALRKTLNVPIEQLARRLGQDRSTVSNYLRLLELDESVQAFIRAGQLCMGHARALLGAPEVHRLRLARQVLDQDLSVRSVERAVQRIRDAKAAGPTPEPRPQIRMLEGRFAQALGVRTKIREAQTGKGGRIVLYYRTLDDFDRIADRLNINVEES